MKQWTRATCVRACGACPALIPIGAPLQVLTFAHVTRELVRCAACADGPIPPDLPATMAPGRRTARMTPIRQLATRADWKARQAQA